MGHIRARSLSKSYVERRRRPRTVSDDSACEGDVTRVLGGINLDCQDGEFVCILGPSGCGKSTLVRILAGFEKSSSGWFVIDDKPVAGPSADNIFVFQHTGLLPWLTVWENARLGVRNERNREEADERVRSALEIVDLTDFEHHYPSQLSGGMQRRAELARALVVNPEILFMDEPFSGLDFLTRMRLREELINMHEYIGKTVVFITHDIDEALMMGNRVIVLSERPSTIKLDLEIVAPRPRDFAKDEALSAQRREIFSALGVHYAL